MTFYHRPKLGRTTSQDHDFGFYFYYPKHQPFSVKLYSHFLNAQLHIPGHGFVILFSHLKDFSDKRRMTACILNSHF